MVKKIKSPPEMGLTITLDSNEIYPLDPGQGTPAMVSLAFPKPFKPVTELDSGTYFCAVETGELSYHGTNLSENQVAWLENQRETVDNFLQARTIKS